MVGGAADVDACILLVFAEAILLSLGCGKARLVSCLCRRQGSHLLSADFRGMYFRIDVKIVARSLPDPLVLTGGQSYRPVAPLSLASLEDLDRTRDGDEGVWLITKRLLRGE